MADIIRLNDDPHAQTQHLLPWYVTGALDGQELAQVEAHLADCAECREDAEIEKALASQVRTLPCDVERGWATLKARIDGAPRPGPRKAALFSRRIPVWWALGAQAAILAIVVPILAFAPLRLYRTLGAAPASASGNLIVVFRPDAPESALRAILTQNQARIVDGPTSTDAYVLHVNPERHAAVLARLKADPDVALAEALDGNDR
jgi:anti-sigma factor RsiW